MRSSGHQVTPIFRDIPGLTWDVLCGILRTPSHTNLQGHPRTVLGCPLWDPLDTKSHQSSKTSQDCPGMSLAGPWGQKVTPIFRDVPGLSWDWDVPCGIYWTPSHTNLLGCPRTVLGCPSWDPPDTKSHQSTETSQDSPGMSDIWDCPKISWTLVGNTGHDWSNSCHEVCMDACMVYHTFLQHDHLNCSTAAMAFHILSSSHDLRGTDSRGTQLAGIMGLEHFLQHTT